MALFERKSQDAEPAPAAPAAPAPSAAQIAASLAQVEAMAAGAPAPVKARVRSIAANLRQALPRLSNLEMGSYEVYSAMATATDYLPTALNAYLRLPRGWADTHPVAGGRTALLLLIDQLDLLDVASRRILDAANASDAQALLTHGIFLEGKFGEPGALRAARGFGIADSPTPGSFGELLAAGAGSLTALTTIEAPPPEPAQELVGEVIAIDCSASMAPNLAAAKEAAKLAVTLLEPGVRFALLCGTHKAYLAYPRVRTGPGMSVRDENTANGAQAVIEALYPDGGTALGTWLKLAARLFDSAGVNGARHVTIISDGGNGNESPAQFQTALAQTAGRLRADVLSIGTPTWELETLASQLGGRAMPLPWPNRLSALLQLMLPKPAPGAEPATDSAPATPARWEEDTIILR